MDPVTSGARLTEGLRSKPLKKSPIRFLNPVFADFAGFGARKDCQRQQHISRSVLLNDRADQGAKIGLAGVRTDFDRHQQHLATRWIWDAGDRGVEDAVDRPDLFLDRAGWDFHSANIE